MKQKILQTIKKYNLIQSGDRIVIGVSGGPDSICLLHILNEIKNELNFEIYVAHINHMIREEAIEETKYVQEFCEKIGVQCFTKKVKVIELEKKEKKGTEEKGREVRYSFFEEVLLLTNSNKIATAHNNNDKVETIIMNILRGSSLTGLKGIEAKRDNKFIRPLIEIERQEIEDYCNDKKLNPKYDKSNDENIYTRNKVRNVVIPYIKEEFNPSINKTINRLSEIATEEDEYLNKITIQKFNEINVGATIGRPHCEEMPENNQIVLDLKKFNQLELVIKRRIILYTINMVLGHTNGIEKVNIDDIIKLCDNNIGNKYLLPIKDIKILVKNRKIFFTPNIEFP